MNRKVRLIKVGLLIAVSVAVAIYADIVIHGVNIL